MKTRFLLFITVLLASLAGCTHRAKFPEPYQETVTDSGIGVLDCSSQEYAIKPTPRCVSIEKANDSTWLMIGADSTAYRVITLSEGFITSSAPDDSTLFRSYNFIRDIAEEYSSDADTWVSYLKECREMYPESFDILGKITYSSGIAYTPGNDLRWHRVVSDILDEATLPRDTIFAQFDEIMETFGIGTQTEINHACYARQVLLQYRLLDLWSTLLDEHPEYMPVYEKWSTWHHEQIQRQIDDLYEGYYYSAMPMDIADIVVSGLSDEDGLIKAQLQAVKQGINSKDLKNQLIGINSALNDNPLIDTWVEFFSEI